MARLAELLDRLEADAGPPDPVPATDGWLLVLAENIGYLVDDRTRWQAMTALRRVVGTAPERILAATDDDLLAVVVGMRPAERVARLRTCAQLRVAGARWSAYPGIGQPGVQRIELFTGVKPVLALDANALRVLVRLGYGDPARSYSAVHRQTQAAAAAAVEETVPARQRAHQLLRRHGQTVCRRSTPTCPACPLADACPSAGSPPPLY
jgi:adenine-specific DNA glycosylase